MTHGIFNNRSKVLTFGLGFVICFAMMLLFYFFAPDGLVGASGNGKRSASCDLKIERLPGYKFISPIVAVSSTTESTRLQPLKHQLEAFIDSLKTAGAASEVSVIIQGLDKNKEIGINRDAQFHPASLMKVALLLSCLRNVQTDAKLLTTVYEFEEPAPGIIQPQFYQYQTLVAGKKYSLHDLLFYMMAYSDNRATWMICNILDEKTITKIYEELNLPRPVRDETKFTMNTQNISTLFRAVYNSTFLSPEFSEYAADLMAHSAFDKGLSAGLPEGSKLWSKFGEWRHLGFENELHEAGVIQIDNRPYLVVIMTKGKETAGLAAIIEKIAKKIHAKTPKA